MVQTCRGGTKNHKCDNLSRSTSKAPFEVITYLKMQNKEQKWIFEILKEQENAGMKDLEIREEVKENIQKN